MKKVVWLASWYPNDADRFTGDFIQRHARATAPFQSIDLLFIGKKPVEPVPGVSALQNVEGLNEHILYYNAGTKPNVFSNWAAARAYARTFRKWFRDYRTRHGLPDIIHVHVAMRAGLIALFLKTRHGIPYVLTEHWTAYFDDSSFPLKNRSPFYRFLIKKIIRNASLLMPVSEDLGRQIRSLAGPVPMEVIPNVVDTRYFFPGTKNRNARFRFIHVSAMSAVKNPEGILSAFDSLIDAGANAELVMVGPVKEETGKIPRYPARVRFTGSIAYKDVATELQQADAFVLFSSRENQPCVILEALCCGLPVIATRIGGIGEVIDEENGLLIEPGNRDHLLASMRQMMQTPGRYDQLAIGEAAMNHYRYEIAGRVYAAVYQRNSV